MEDRWQKRSRILIHALIWSGALNIGLFASLVYQATQKPTTKQEMVVEAVSLSQTNASTVKGYFNHSFRELVAALSDDTLLEDGYTARDLALSCLVEYHDFYLDRALSGYDYQTRHMTFVHNDCGEKVQLPVFPGLSNAHFDQIRDYALSEKWPLTAEGLFFEMKRRRDGIDHSLKDAFYHTPHFATAYSVLALNDGVTKEEVLGLILEGEFDTLKQLYKEQRIKTDLSNTRRGLFLHSYLAAHSTIAPYLLVRLEPEYTRKRLNDEEIIQVIGGLKIETESGKRFLESLVHSVRSDQVQIAAAQRLGRVLEVKNAKPRPEIKPVPKRVHTVVEGDSLWKIARQHGVSIEKLAQKNGLNKDRYIRPGQQLEIP